MGSSSSELSGAWACRPRGSEQGNRDRGRRPEACRSRSAGLRPRDCPAPICEAGREIARPERPRHFPAPVCRPQASRFPCPDLQASGLAISLPRSAGLRPCNFSSRSARRMSLTTLNSLPGSKKIEEKTHPSRCRRPELQEVFTLQKPQMKAMNHRWHLESTSKSLQKGSLDCKPTQKA